MTVLRDIRVIPLVIAALAGLAVLKISALVMDAHHVSVFPKQAVAVTADAPDFKRPRAHSSQDMGDITGSVGGRRSEKIGSDPDRKNEQASEQQTIEHNAASPEQDVLDSLQERRRQLDARSREIDIRDNILTAAEENLKVKIKNIEAREKLLIAAQEKQQEENEVRVKSLVAIYEGMKPKEAAKIFSRMEMPVLVEITSRISPRKMSEILGLMQMEVAEKLTVELVRRAGLEKSIMLSDLPKIEGVSTGLRH